MKTTLILSVMVLALVFTGCDKDDEEEMKSSSVFKVSIQNVMEEKDFLSSGVFNTPAGEGIELFDGGMAIDGDITSSIMLYDAGTEVNELPGVGIHQPARLNGGENENGNVRSVDDMFTYPTVAGAVKITITPM